MLTLISGREFELIDTSQFLVELRLPYSQAGEFDAD